MPVNCLMITGLLRMGIFYVQDEHDSSEIHMGFRRIRSRCCVNSHWPPLQEFLKESGLCGIVAKKKRRIPNEKKDTGG